MCLFRHIFLGSFNARELDEYVVFVTPTTIQLSIFMKILHPDRLDDLIQSSTAESLALINILTKVSNSPILLRATADKAKANCKDTLQKSGLEEASRLIPERAQIDDVTLSGMTREIDNFALTNLVLGKLCALAKLLSVIYSVCKTHAPIKVMPRILLRIRKKNVF